LRLRHVGPRIDGLEDRAFRTGINPGL
jgi:hypothetical protein